MKRHKHFYHHLIEIDSVHLALDDLDLTQEEKQDLIIIVDDNIHHTVLDTVLSELESGDKKAFLALIVAQDHNEVWELLSERIENAEGKIKKAVNNLLAKLHEDILEAHEKRKNHT